MWTARRRRVWWPCPTRCLISDFTDFKAELDLLPADQREALVLIGASGFSYEEAAEICGVAVGTIKSRVNRARRRLIERLALQTDEQAVEAPNSTKA